MTTIDTHSLSGSISGVEILPVSGSITLDEGYSPYCRAELVCALPPLADRDALDLRQNALRLDLRGRQDFGKPWPLSRITDDVGGSAASFTAKFGGHPISGISHTYSEAWNAYGLREATARSFSLTVTSRIFDHTRKEMRVTAMSDEALMHLDRLVASTAFIPPTTSVRALVNIVLARYGAALQDGPSDGTVSAASISWEPGVTAWEYLKPLLQSVSLRLWCDESGIWYLTETQPTAPGALVLTPTGTMTNAVDEMSIESDWYDAVVVKYAWTDEFDLARVAYDVAGAQPARNAFLREFSTPYPGPGAAAGILRNAKGRGRVLGIGAVSDYRAQPGLPSVVTPPDTEPQTGYVSSVTWEFPGAEMSVTTRGLVDTPISAWLFVEPGTSWISMPIGMSWLEYEGA